MSKLLEINKSIANYQEVKNKYTEALSAKDETMILRLGFIFDFYKQLKPKSIVYKFREYVKDIRTFNTWIRRFNNEGLEGLKPRNRNRKQKIVNQKQVGIIQELVLCKQIKIPRKDREEVFLRATGVHLSESQMYWYAQKLPEKKDLYARDLKKLLKFIAHEKNKRKRIIKAHKFIKGILPGVVTQEKVMEYIEKAEYYAYINKNNFTFNDNSSKKETQKIREPLVEEES